MKPVLDWSAYHDAGMGDAYADIPARGGDFARAVAVCINSRQCQQQRKGVMCPSYRVTGEAMQSTGGRVALLKAVLNGERGQAGFTDKQLEQAMDLCVACKGCKRECENEVDMAMIKTEYLAQRLRGRKPDLRTRLFANLAANLQYYGCFRYMPALLNRSRLLSWLLEKMLGISAQRQLPEPSRRSFDRLLPAGMPSSGTAIDNEAVAGEVALLIDTFTNHFNPGIAQAAIRVLGRAGYHVHIVEQAADMDSDGMPLCCGRTQLAHGLVSEARDNAVRMMKALLPHVRDGRFIIGLEPSCLLAIRDDYRFLGLGKDADKLASHVLLFEEFVAREVKAGRMRLELDALADTTPVMVHGHCHQKAVGAMKSMRKVLKMIPGLKYEIIDASCCGMAGSFGIEQEHADIAMQMAEDALLPALRQQPQARIVANGFSCRHQIEQGVQRNAIHIAVLLNEALPA